MGDLIKVFDMMPPLHSILDPNIAAIIGVIFGPLGLAFYFQSIVDLLVMVTLIGTSSVVASQFGFIFAWLMSGTYGYFRVVNSNQRHNASPF